MKKKLHRIMVTVSADANLSAFEVRREVRTLVNNQSFWMCSVDETSLRAQKVQPAPRVLDTVFAKLGR